MKKILLILLSIGVLFASSNDEINKKLDLLLQKINQLEQKVDKKDAEIKTLKEKLKKQEKEIIKTNKQTTQKFAVKSCKKIKVIDFKYKYNNDIIPSYDLTITLKNNYPKKIVYLVGNLFVEDKDKIKFFKDYIKREVNLPVNGEITIKKTHSLNSDLEKYLKDEDIKNDKVYFEVIKAEFADGTTLECGIF